MARIFIMGFILVGLMTGLYLFSTLDNLQMTNRQKLLKVFYPVLSRFSKNKEIANKGVTPPVSFYELQAIKNDGTDFDFTSLMGKKVLIVNTASDCGYTAQYRELQLLYQQQGGNLVILAFPANDFKNQEPESNEAIANFCKVNYQVTFPLMQKTVVINSLQQNEVYRWLTDKNKNGWNTQQPEWNFSKYLVNEKGELTNYFSSGVSPLGKEIRNALYN